MSKSVDENSNIFIDQLPNSLKTLKKDSEFNKFLKRIEKTLISLERQNRELKKELKDLSHLKDEVIKDPLTGLYTRKYFEEITRKEIHNFYRTDTPLTIAFLDLDDFKLVNDTYGHNIGDFVLKEFGKILLQSTRKNDVPARYGGEEFTILLTNSKIKDMLIVLKRVKEGLLKSKELKDKNLKVTFSAGVSTYSDQLGDLYNLIEDADKKLYKAKNSGKDRVIID